MISVWVVQMDEFLGFSFHIGGTFVRQGRDVRYVGGDVKISFIDMDKVSLQ